MMSRPSGPPRSSHDISEAVLSYMRGELIDSIADRYNVKQPTVSYWMKRYGKRFGGKDFKLRSQGRRKETEPNDRDKDIVMLYSMGVPAAHIGRLKKLSRQRTCRIIEVWRQRHYRPELPFRKGDTVKYGNERYLLNDVYDAKSGRATLISDGTVVDPFFFFAGGIVTKLAKKGELFVRDQALRHSPATAS